MRRGQRQNAITNSPVVRSFIRPVLASIPAPSSGAVKRAVLLTEVQEWDGEGEGADERWLIPTQPGGGEGEAVGTSDVKGKKRARDDDDDGQSGEVRAAEYDPVAGTRYGVPVRYAEEDLPAELEKYWAQRYRLFSLFDDGCEMDREGWFSVTPENVAAQIAERCRSGVVLDAFCGVGGNAIQFAFTCERVIALDTSPVRLACAAHNAAIYGVADRITFLQCDYVAWSTSYAERLARGEVSEEERVEVVFLSPPWGGIDYQTTLSTSASALAGPPPSKKAKRASDAAPAYPLSALAPLPGAELFALARRCTPNVALFLPRNVDLYELAQLPGLAEGEKVEVEEAWMGHKCKAVTVYTGELALGNGYVEDEQ